MPDATRTPDENEERVRHLETWIRAAMNAETLQDARVLLRGALEEPRGDGSRPPVLGGRVNG